MNSEQKSSVQQSVLQVINPGKSGKGGKAEPRLSVTYATKKGGSQPWNVKRDQLSSSLRPLSLQELGGMEVEFDLINGHPGRIRRPGEAWSEPSPPSAGPKPPRKEHGGHGKGYPQKPDRRDDRRNSPSGRSGNLPCEFANPYNFVPALPRDKVANDLGNASPKGHHRYHPECWSGRIGVKLETVTPLLIPDAARMISDSKEHKTYPVRVDDKGAPYLPPTSVKGMLRAAYEAVTNSRMGVFQGHDERLAYRSAAKGGARVVPARVTDDGNHIELLPGFSEIGADGKPLGNPPVMYAACLPMYHRLPARVPNLENPENVPLKTRQIVWAEVELWEHYVSDKYSDQWKNNFNYWRVLRITSGDRDHPQDNLNSTPPRRRDEARKGRSQSFHNPISSEVHRWVKGYILITNKNMDNKHDERIFFVCGRHPQELNLKLEISQELRDKWVTLIKNYQEEHKKEIDQGLEKPPALNDRNCRFSYHIKTNKDIQNLSSGTLCYVSVKNKESGGFDVLDIYPVMISRDLYQVAPEDLLSRSLQPAQDINELSPADRVFGWANQKGKGAWKGQLRIGPIRCGQGDKAIETFPKPLPLAILGQPKPQQARFYAAENDNGEPLRKGAEKDYGYKPNGGLRGRKVYLHQKWATQIKDYWSNAGQNEYSRDECDNQNRSITGWVKPKITFYFDIHVTNLSAVELGTLLWLLNLEDGLHHRLGGGKPLGFGSVRLSITDMDLRDGGAWKDYYSNLFSEKFQDGRIREIAEVVNQYQQAVKEAHGKPFHEVTFIKAFKAAARGFENLPVHYPRRTKPPNLKGENFKWFVENEKKENRLALPKLGEDRPCLPLYEEEEPNPRNQGTRPRHPRR